MCLTGAVGRNAPNAIDDVKTVQVLLNMNLGKLIPLAPLTCDGGIGAITNNAILEFQMRVCGSATADGRVDPGGATLRLLREGIPKTFTSDVLQGIMIRAKPATVSKFVTPLVNTMQRYDISTPLRQAHFLAQLAHESGDMRYTEEIASGEAYEGRKDLGNTSTGDGKRFKGRGLIQLTGRANYVAYGKLRGQDFTTDDGARQIASNPELAVDVAGWYWSTRRLNRFADIDDITAITRLINGGYNGLDDRKRRLVRARFFLTS